MNLLGSMWRRTFLLLDRLIPGDKTLRYVIWKLREESPTVPASRLRFCLVYYCSKFDPVQYEIFKASAERQTYRNFAVVVADRELEHGAFASFDYLCFVEQGDQISRHALAALAAELCGNGRDIVFTDEDEMARGQRRRRPLFKPEFSRYLLWSTDYVTSLCCVKARPEMVDFLVKNGVSRETLYSLALNADPHGQNVARLPKVLYHRGTGKELHQSGRKAVLEEFLSNKGLLERVSVTATEYGNRLAFKPSSAPLVSIVIPFRDKAALTRTCVESIERSTYRNLEIILVDNRSVEPETSRFLEQTPHRVVRADFAFNYSRLNNLGVEAAQGEYLVLMNNDIEVITTDWLENLLGLAELPDVGAVAPKLLYTDGTVQHAGMVLLEKKGPKHVNRHLPGNAGGYGNFNNLMREYLAFTGACIAVAKRKYLEVNGFDEELSIISNDADFCLKLHERGYANVFTPAAVLYHHESASRRGKQKGERAENLRRFRERWQGYFGKDPCYNPNLSQQRADFAVRIDIT